MEMNSYFNVQHEDDDEKKNLVDQNSSLMLTHKSSPHQLVTKVVQTMK